MATLQFYGKNAGTWKYGIPWVKVNGAWEVAKKTTVWKAYPVGDGSSILYSETEFRDFTPPGYVNNSTLVSVRNSSFQYYFDYNSLPAGNIFIRAAIFRGYGPHRFQWDLLTGSGVVLYGDDSGYILGSSHECQVTGDSGGYCTLRCQPTTYWGGSYDPVIVDLWFA